MSFFCSLSVSVHTTAIISVHLCVSAWWSHHHVNKSCVLESDECRTQWCVNVHLHQGKGRLFWLVRQYSRAQQGQQTESNLFVHWAKSFCVPAQIAETENFHWRPALKLQWRWVLRMSDYISCTYSICIMFTLCIYCMCCMCIFVNYLCK